ncbi:FAD/NAD(P)-binding domain-containing protein [Hypoxylon cercidicola]|nr:FAD/NAD(P)-binding domain-containing protein [Hypoxylon cercidicola]
MDSNMKLSEKPLKVVIVGGSLAGLMCGIALKHAGHTVEIIEREGNERQSHMAGVCLGSDAEAYLARHDRHDKAFTHRSTRVQALKSDETINVFVNMCREITSWDTLYFRLRSCFDGYVSPYYPTPPASVEADGAATYNCQKEVLGITRESKSKMVLTVLNRDHGEISRKEADLVIGADGPDSFVRAKYLPQTKREYVGYIAWRGTVPESEVSASTRKVFERSVTVHMMHRHHCIMYTIPGPKGSLKPGERLLNFLWYTNESPEALDEILTDGIDGHRHHNIVPAGHVRAEIWAARLEHAKGVPLPPPFLEAITKIRQPFLQAITELLSPRAAFEDGRVLLVGDALSLFRPHTAFSGTQAAFDALRVEDYVGGGMSARGWEEKVLRYASLHWSQTRWWGKYYQQPMGVALVSAVKYWGYCAVDRARSWWYGEAPLLRTSTFRVEEYES